MAPVLHNSNPLPTYKKDVQKTWISKIVFLQPHLESADDQRFKKRRRTGIRLISIFIICYMAYSIARTFLSAPVILNKGCYSAIQSLEQPGMHRNLSTAKLPVHYILPSGDKISAIGLGVWRANPNEVGEAVKSALRAGYRHIDGAWIYGNEHEVGNAIKQSSVPREQIWITSKLWNTFHSPEDVEPALDQTLERLGTSYIDLYLIHWPVAFKSDKRDIDFDLTENPYPTWKKMEEMVKKGKVRNIGVSNFNIQRIQNLTANPIEIKPALNQVELSYWNPQPELVKWSRENGIILQAYSPLGSAEKVKESLQIPEVKYIAKKLGMTPAQVYISWHIQRGTVVLPKSVSPSRIAENFQVHLLPQDAFERLEKAARGHQPLRTVNPNWGVDIWN